MAKKILIIVEGEADEVRFLEDLFKKCNKKKQNIKYTLIKQIFMFLLKNCLIIIMILILDI